MTFVVKLKSRPSFISPHLYMGYNHLCCMRTISSVAKYMSRASEENVRNLKVTVETLGFHLVGRPTAA